MFAFSLLTLLIWHKEGHQVCKIPHSINPHKLYIEVWVLM